MRIPHSLFREIKRRDVGVIRGFGPGSSLPESTSYSLARQLAAQQTSPSGVAMEREASQTLADAIAKMSQLDQETIALRHFVGLSNTETAEVLGVSVTASSNRHVRALTRLREIMDQMGKEVQ
ncbi:MAG: hypothetical protein HKN47_05320 [Pirellulaceae bacterium]|nr:hypothetical protein [Pirellulaceae bacterium]